MNEYIYRKGPLVHVIKLHSTSNRKLGVMRRVITTYHFDIDQVKTVDLKNDRRNCMSCPMSYTNNGGVSGKCYTHSGLQRLGLLAMLKRLNKLAIPNFSKKQFDLFLANIKTRNVELLRFGAYGEAVRLGEYVFTQLAQTFTKRTGYTHQWNHANYQFAAPYIQASTHNQFEVQIANDMGWRVFNLGKIDNGINCPASKESGNKTTCTQCVLCNGSTGNSKKNIFINQH